MGPYREPEEDVEAKLDALEVAALKASFARGTWRIRAAVLLCVVGPIATAVGVMALWVSSRKTPVPSAPHTPRCETHLVYPSAGDPFPMTVCR